MMEGIRFSRQICDEDPDYMVTVIRTPRIASEDCYAGAYTGEVAQRKATKFILSAAAGMLNALGAFSLAQAVVVVRQHVEQVADVEERKAAAN